MHDEGLRDRERFWSLGFLLKPDLISWLTVASIREQAMDLFRAQAARLGVDDPDPERAMVRLYERDFDAFFNCGKQVQHLVDLHRLGVSDDIISGLRALGMERPIISTRPVCYFNNPATASKESYHRVFAHQDWRSMQGSVNSVVVWIPLIDIPMDLGALEVSPKSHLRGLLTTSVEDGFGRVDASVVPDDAFVPIETRMGDVLFFSSFLVHRSGNNTSGRFRWSCHFRYNDAAEASFIDRGYPHAYVYRPTPELLRPGFPASEALSRWLGALGR